MEKILPRNIVFSSPLAPFNCKSVLNEKYFAAIFQSKIWEKTRKFDSNSFCIFTENIAIKKSLGLVVHNMVHPWASMIKSSAIQNKIIF